VIFISFFCSFLKLLSGLDLVELQIRVAEGYTFAELGISQNTLQRKGHAIRTSFVPY